MNKEEIHAVYLDHMGSDLTVVNAARASFGSESCWESSCWNCNYRESQATWTDDNCPRCKADCAGHLAEPLLNVGDANLIRFLALGYRASEWEGLIEQFFDAAKREDRLAISDMLRIHKNKPQHWAPFGHPHLQIRMTLPIFLGRQFVKHQVGGVWSEESRRYISDEPGVWFPDQWHTRPDDIKQGSGGLVENQDAALHYATMGTASGLAAYDNLLKVDVAPEEARIVLPLNMMTTVVWTGSLAFWARVVNQRVEAHAQGAAKILGRQISAIVQPHFPESWKWLISPDLQ